VLVHSTLSRFTFLVYQFHSQCSPTHRAYWKCYFYGTLQVHGNSGTTKNALKWHSIWHWMPVMYNQKCTLAVALFQVHS